MNLRDVLALLGGEQFGTVLDLGGNVGRFAAQAHQCWPDAWLLSLEPVPELARLNVVESRGRWQVGCYGVSDTAGRRELLVCVSNPLVSTMQQPGEARRREFGADDSWQPIEVETVTLNSLVSVVRPGRLLVKIDVEGHEEKVIEGGLRLLSRADAVLCELNQDPEIFEGAPSPRIVDGLLQGCGLRFCGVAGVQLAPSGRILQFDGVWLR